MLLSEESKSWETICADRLASSIGLCSFHPNYLTRSHCCHLGQRIQSQETWVGSHCQRPWESLGTTWLWVRTVCLSTWNHLMKKPSILVILRTISMHEERRCWRYIDIYLNGHISLYKSKLGVIQHSVNTISSKNQSI